MRPRCDKDPNFYYDYVALLSTMCCTSKIGIEMMGLWPERIDPGLFQVLSDSLCVLDSKTGVIFWPLLIRRYWKCHGVDRPLSWGRISISLAKSRRSCCWIGSTRCVVPVCAPRPGVPVSLDTHLYSLYVIHVTSCYMFISVYTLCHPLRH